MIGTSRLAMLGLIFATSACFEMSASASRAYLIPPGGETHTATAISLRLHPEYGDDVGLGRFGYDARLQAVGLPDRSFGIVLGPNILYEAAEPVYVFGGGAAGPGVVTWMLEAGAGLDVRLLGSRRHNVSAFGEAGWGWLRHREGEALAAGSAAYPFVRVGVSLGPFFADP